VNGFVLVIISFIKSSVMVVMEQFLRRKGYGAIILFQLSHSKQLFCRRMNTHQAEINGALTTVMGLVLKSFQ